MAKRRLQPQSSPTTRVQAFVKNWPALLAAEAGLALLLPILATGVSLALWSQSVDSSPVVSVVGTERVEPSPAAVPVASLSSTASEEPATLAGDLAPAPPAARAEDAGDPVAAAAVEKHAAEDDALALAPAVSTPPPDLSKSVSAQLDEVVEREIERGRAARALNPSPPLKLVPPPQPVAMLMPGASPEVAEHAAVLADLEGRAVELDLRGDAESVPELLHPPFSRPGRTALVNVLRGRPDLAGIPLRDAELCEIGTDQAQRATIVSLGIRRLSTRNGARQIAEILECYDETILKRFGEMAAGTAPERRLAKQINKAQTDVLGPPNQPVRESLASVLAQMLQVETKDIRMKLVEHLYATPGPAASLALADRALFDLSGTVRRAATAALEKRPRWEYQQRLVDGLRYVWPPVAEHASQALAQLGDPSAIALVAPLVDEPDPALPRLNEENRWVVRQLVRVNHFRNCLLCHSASQSPNDLVRGAIPSPGQSLLPSGYGGSGARGIDFVRADTLYLKQDFSVMHTVADHQPWPLEQRFDYFVRTRELTPDEVAQLPAARPGERLDYPQRESVLAALRELKKVRSTSAPSDRLAGREQR
jgi:hypothetical protein